VIYYATIQRYLHPLDMGGMTIPIVLTEAGWAEAAGESEKQRVVAVKKFFEEAVKENCNRAARREPPMSYEQAKARWVRFITNLYPQLSMAAASHQAAAMGGQKSSGGGSGAGRSGGANSSGTSSGRSGQTSQRPGQKQYTPARHMGMPVCFGYNSPAGCRRQGGTAAATCTDGKTHFAHVCNYFDRTKNAHCLAQHPRVNNH